MPDDLRDLLPPAQSGSRFAALPATGVGRLAGGLAVAFVALLAVWAAGAKIHVEAALVVSLSAFRLAGLCGVVSAVLSLTAMVARGERSWVVWLGLVPGAAMIAAALVELLWME